MATKHPQQTLLYRLVALMSRRTRWVDIDPDHRVGLPAGLFVAAVAALALAILLAAAVVAKQVWILVPLGPSAFALLRTPMSARSSPRALIGAHAMASGVGLLTWWLSAVIDPAGPGSPQEAALGRLILQFGVAAVATGLLMQAVRCVHAPAIGTSALAAWGTLASVPAVVALLGAVVLLVFGAVVLLRLVAGWPYPLWTADPQVCRQYGSLAGMPAEAVSFWERLEGRIQRGA